MRIEPEHSQVSIVLVGSLNPATFHPSWFGANRLLNAEEVESAQVELVHREMTIFRAGEWLKLQVEPNRFIAETGEPPFVRLCDLVVRTFRECLHHTPIRMLGINRSVHFSVGDEATRNRIGKLLAPQEPWGEWGGCLEGPDAERRGGVRSLTMEQRDLDDREAGHIRAKIEPSGLIRTSSGIFMEINDHYELRRTEDPLGADLIVDLLEERFEGSVRRAEWIVDQIMALKERS